MPHCTVNGIVVYLCTDAKTIPTDMDNLAFRAVKAFTDAIGLRDLEKYIPTDTMLIDIRKDLPVSAGIGGGSANAAVVLLGLNEMTGRPFTLRQLMNMGAESGADVPFSTFMNAYRNRDVLTGLDGLEEASDAAWTSGIGEIVEPAESVPRYVILANPGTAISTKAAYKAFDEIGYTAAEKKLFINEFAAAGDDATKKKAAADDFFRIVGTHFITKCLLGCELNYRMTVDSSKVVKSTDVKAALDFKWQQQIKDTTGVDSVTKAKILEQMKDSTKLKNFFFSGNVQVTDAQFNAASSTRAKVKARGNDVQLVNILATGGSLNCTDLAQWMLGAEPEKAAMVGMQVHPIYDIFDGSVAESDEAKAREYLVEYIDKSFSLDESKYGNELTIDLSDLK